MIHDKIANNKRKMKKMKKKLIYPVIYSAFFMTGFSALVYQVAWSRMLHLIFGVTLFAVATVVISFMAGLFAGNIAAARLTATVRRPLSFYAAAELAVGLYGLLTPGVVGVVDSVSRSVAFNYPDIGVSSPHWAVGRFALCFAALFPPTFLMGMTLPLLSFFLFSRGMARGQALGVLYGANTMGAFAGAVAAGFFLIAEAGVSGSIRIAAFINIAAAAAVYAAARGAQDASDNNGETGSEPASKSSVKKNDDGTLFGSGGPGRGRDEGASEAVVSLLSSGAAVSSPADNPCGISETAGSTSRMDFEAWLLAFIFISGFVSLGYEVIWSRVFSMFLRNAPHAFSAVLAAYLAGVGLGSLVYSRFCGVLPEEGKKFYFTLANLASIVSVYAGYITLYGIYEAGAGAYGSLFSGYIIALVKSTLIAVFPAAFFMGITLPMAIEIVIAGHVPGGCAVRAGSAAAGLYSLNISGAIFGTAVTGFFLIPGAGVNGTLAILMFLSAAVNALLVWRLDFKTAGRKAAWFVLNLFVASAVVAVPDTAFMIAESRLQEIYPGVGFDYYKDDAVASVGVSANRVLFVDARPMTIKVSVLKLMAHLPLALVRGDAKKMLIICLGEGMTLKSAMLHEGLMCDAVELSGGVIEAYRQIFGAGRPLLNGSRLVEDDGRSFIQFCRGGYDVVTIDPPPPLYGSGAVNFHTREFYARARAILNDGGVLCQWFPFQTDSKTYLMALRSFAEEFPECLAWAVPENVGILMVGRKGRGKFRIDMKKFAASFKKDAIAEDIGEFAVADARAYIADPFYLASLLKGDGASVMKAAAGLGCVTDDRPALEFSYRAYCDELDAAYLRDGRKYLQHAPLIEAAGFRPIDMLDGFDDVLKNSTSEISVRFAKKIRGE